MPDLDAWAKLLTRRVQDGIPEREARQLYRQIRRGEVNGDALPADSVRILVDRRIVNNARNHLRRQQPGRGIEDRIQDAFEASVRRLAASYDRGAISLAELHEGLKDRIAIHTTEQVLAGSKRSIPTVEQYRRIQQVLDRESAYLSRFMDTVAAQQAKGEPVSIAVIRQRAALYGGNGRAEFYRAAESTFPPTWVAYYESRDDGGTCSRCLEAERNSPYPRGEGPMPGSICYGKSRCRCRRVLRQEARA